MTLSIAPFRMEQRMHSLGRRLHSHLQDVRLVIEVGASWRSLIVTCSCAAAGVAILILLANRTHLELIPLLVTGCVFLWPLITGGCTATYALASIGRERAGAVRFTATALALTSERKPIDSDALRRFEPAAAEARTTVAGVVKRVVLACSEGRYESVATILALDLPAVRAGSYHVRRTQLFAVRIGILTTFIGLMWCLNDIVPVVLNSASGNKAQTLVDVVQAMAAAFGGSVAGLAAATILQVLAGSVERHENDLLREIEGVILAIQTYYTYATTKEPLIRSIEGLSQQIGRFSRQLDDGCVNIDRAANNIALQIRAQDEMLRTRLAELVKGKDAFGDLVTEQQLAVEGLEKTIKEGAERIGDEFRTWIEAEVQVAAANALTQGLNEGRSALASHSQAVEKSLTEVTKGGLSEAKEALVAHARTIETSVENASKATVESLTQAIWEMNAAEATRNRLLVVLSIGMGTTVVTVIALAYFLLRFMFWR